MRHLLAALAITLAPAAAYACGGLFCDTSTPVEQAAERILFGHDGERLHMHVQITYQGPPTEFGWLLPTPRDVEVDQSSEELFALLDRNFGPRFVLRTEFGESCEFNQRGGVGAEADDANGAGGEGGVQVLSRENVGPFDISTLLPDTVEDLRAWLDDNGYQIPAETDDTLRPYVELESAFVAVKLLPDRDAGDISPLRLSFTSPRAAVPIVPTSVAATPDMGIIVHVLGEHRAIPLNYRHVVINEAAIEWVGGGQNYPDVVSQAADEAGGKAFATDYAGPAGSAPRVFGEAVIERVRTAESARQIIDALGLDFGVADADLVRVMSTGIMLPPELTMAEYLGCPFCFDDDDFATDGAALAAVIEDEIDPARRHLAELFEARPYLTRLYSTMSPAEMDLDPEFEHNPDLGDVPNIRTAVQRVTCGFDGEPDFDTATIETPSGLRFRQSGGVNPGAVQRQAGETVRGGDVPAAQTIERTLMAGPSEVITDNSAEIRAALLVDEDGCACSATEGDPAPTLAALGLLALLGLRRRR